MRRRASIALLVCTFASGCSDDGGSDGANVLGSSSSGPAPLDPPVGPLGCGPPIAADEMTLHGIFAHATDLVTSTYPDAIATIVLGNPLEADGTLDLPPTGEARIDDRWSLSYQSAAGGVDIEVEYYEDDGCPFSDVRPIQIENPGTSLDISIVPDSPALVSMYLSDPACPPLSEGAPRLAVLGFGLPGAQIQVLGPGVEFAPIWAMNIMPDGTQSVDGCP